LLSQYSSLADESHRVVVVVVVVKHLLIIAVGKSAVLHAI
jgi:hypothetical protein